MKINPINNIYQNDNTNFKARLDITKVKTNKTRWKNIAKTFSENTKHIDDTMKITEFKNDTVISGPSRYKKIKDVGNINAIAYNETIEQLLTKYDDNAIVKKLIKLLDIGNVAESRKEKAMERFCTNPYTAKKSLKYEYDSIDEAARNKANKDAFLRNFEIVL